MDLKCIQKAGTGTTLAKNDVDGKTVTFESLFLSWPTVVGSAVHLGNIQLSSFGELDVKYTCANAQCDTAV